MKCVSLHNGTGKLIFQTGGTILGRLDDSLLVSKPRSHPLSRESHCRTSITQQRPIIIEGESRHKELRGREFRKRRRGLSARAFSRNYSTESAHCTYEARARRSCIVYIGIKMPKEMERRALNIVNFLSVQFLPASSFPRTVLSARLEPSTRHSLRPSLQVSPENLTRELRFEIALKGSCARDACYLLAFRQPRDANASLFSDLRRHFCERATNIRFY